MWNVVAAVLLIAGFSRLRCGYRGGWILIAVSAWPGIVGAGEVLRLRYWTVWRIACGVIHLCIAGGIIANWLYGSN